MSYDDFMKNMHMLDIVHLGPQTFSRLGLPEVNIHVSQEIHLEQIL